MVDHIDALTVVIEGLKKRSELRDQLLALREELRVDPFACELLCELQPQRATRVIFGLVEVLCER